ncbi:MAG: aminotransferase class I/II-fold pyridoxal phosphate-dependent enzyme, partial [Planctomycetes bacterium]|nr:aminotransferase class I/II-fold pyridoxal phosphate-dependent enzyme [Planctomycetota bacterium]
AGYLGSVLCPLLLSRGYGVRCFDRLFFGGETLSPCFDNPDFELVEGNLIRPDEVRAALEGVDAVVHLAGLSNDPSCDLEPDMTELANFQGTIGLAEEARRQGIRRLVFASSCSVYGQGLEPELTEDSPVRPVSLYARAKVRAEEALLKLRDGRFEPVIFRQATLFGFSPRMRFDLAINLMTLHGVLRGKIYVLGGGLQWRPFLHVGDAAEAFAAALLLPAGEGDGLVLNVGATDLNFQIRDLAHMVRDELGGIEVEEAPGDTDRRTYRVRFDRASDVLGWRPARTVHQGVREIAEALRSGRLGDPTASKYYNIRRLKELQEVPVREGGEPLRAQFLPFALPSIGPEEEQEILDTLRSGWITTGPRTAEFERRLAAYLGVPEVVAVSSCTAALHLSLIAAGVGPGDEVITSPVTWPSTANVIVHTGATPVFADIDRDTFNIRPDEIEKRMTPKTKAIIPVHIAGQPCEMEAIRRIAKAWGTIVIEDAAHAIGAEYRGRRVGAGGDFACFSFYPTKNITTGEGGAVAVSDPERAETIRLWSLHGVTRGAWNRYAAEGGLHWDLVVPGYKYNMPDLGAALGIHQLAHLDAFIETRRRYARLYDESFLDLAEIIRPRVLDGIRHAYHLYIIMIRPEMLRVDRDEFAKHLRAENVGVGFHFRSLHLSPYYRERLGIAPEDYPNARFTSDRILSLPLYPRMSVGDVLQVAEIIRKLVRFYRR